MFALGDVRQAVQDGQREGGGFAGSCAGTPQHIPALQHMGNRLLLNGRGFGVPFLANGFQQAVIQIDSTYIQAILNLPEPFELSEAAIALYDNTSYVPYLKRILNSLDSRQGTGNQFKEISSR